MPQKTEYYRYGPLHVERQFYPHKQVYVKRDEGDYFLDLSPNDPDYKKAIRFMLNEIHGYGKPKGNPDMKSFAMAIVKKGKMLVLKSITINGKKYACGQSFSTFDQLTQSVKYLLKSRVQK